MPNSIQTIRALLLAGLLLPLAACATPPTDPAARAEFEATNDPFEPTNRVIFEGNDFFYTYLVRPIAKAYVWAVPQFGRDRIHNFLQNLNEPVIWANDMLQGEWHAADVTTGRFLANSTFGIGGLWDIAADSGLDKQSGDFGQTLYHYGVPDGPYLVLPILGPSNPRDAIGMGADSEADPFDWLASYYGHGGATWYRFGAEGIDEYAGHMDELDELKKNSIDYYAAIRSLWRQHRATELRHGAPAPSPVGLEGLYDNSTPASSQSASQTASDDSRE
ncbi:MAG TPA: VacJ family lipoprotein [Stellaceae bacterium]|nr:VacJ family lipoprotein [Stellaceae bacterium]